MRIPPVRLLGRRLPGVELAPAHLTVASMVAGVVLLSVLVATLVGMLGLFGFAVAAAPGTTVPATVRSGASCAEANPTEAVTFTIDGTEHQARFNGCGHQEGEPVEVTVPAGAGAADLVVHAARAATGNSENWRSLGLLLLVTGGVAGAGFAFLARAPRGARLPAPTRPAPAG